MSRKKLNFFKKIDMQIMQFMFCLLRRSAIPPNLPMTDREPVSKKTSLKPISLICGLKKKYEDAMSAVFQF